VWGTHKCNFCMFWVGRHGDDRQGMYYINVNYINSNHFLRVDYNELQTKTTQPNSSKVRLQHGQFKKRRLKSESDD